MTLPWPHRDRDPYAGSYRGGASAYCALSTQGFYAWLKAPVTKRDWSDAHLINAALDVRESDPTYGYRFISDELPAVGTIASERRVWWLCSQQRIWSTSSKERGVPGFQRSSQHWLVSWCREARQACSSALQELGIVVRTHKVRSRVCATD